VALISQKKESINAVYFIRDGTTQNHVQKPAFERERRKKLGQIPDVFKSVSGKGLGTKILQCVLRLCKMKI
jgi:uncharacterized protein (UPF0335 family)